MILSTISSGLCVIKPVQFCRLKLSPGCCEDYKRSFPGVGSNTLGSSLEHLALVIVGGIAGGDIAAPMCQWYIYLVLLFFIHTCFLTKKNPPQNNPTDKKPKRNVPQCTNPQDLSPPSSHQMPIIWVFTCQWGMLSLVTGPYYQPCNRLFYNNLQVFSRFMKISAKPVS